MEAALHWSEKAAEDDKEMGTNRARAGASEERLGGSEAQGEAG
jgi:hypothetical protein